MAALKIFFSRTKKALRLSLGIQHLGLKVYQFYSNNDPRQTFDLLKARSDLHSHHLYGKNVEKSFSQNVLKTTVILFLPLIQEGQLSVSGKRMCILLVNRLED